MLAPFQIVVDIQTGRVQADTEKELGLAHVWYDCSHMLEWLERSFTLVKSCSEILTSATDSVYIAML